MVDGHAHFHPGYAFDRFFDHADGNFRAAGDAAPEGALRCLVLAQCEGREYFGRWRERPDVHGGDRWSLEGRGSAAGLAAVRSDGREILLVAGRQIRTGDGLEVLAVGRSEESVPGEGSLLETVGAVWAAGAVPVVPWGFGKWILRRGRKVRRLLRSGRRGPLFLGDSGGRWSGWPPPSLFREARRLGVYVLSGSDPLPLPGGADRVGGYGFLARDDRLDPDRPAESLIRTLRDLHEQPAVFGRRAPLRRFVQEQVAMQLRERLPGAGPGGE